MRASNIRVCRALLQSTFNKIFCPLRINQRNGFSDEINQKNLVIDLKIGDVIKGFSTSEKRNQTILSRFNNVPRKCK